MSIKMFVDISIIIGNVIDIYILAFIAVAANAILYSIYLGSIILVLVYFLFIFYLEIFLWILCLIECFSIYFQSLTLANRISINLVAGFLLNYLIGLLCSNYIIFIMDLFSINCFEFSSSFFQLFIYCLLSLEYFL